MNDNAEPRTEGGTPPKPVEVETDSLNTHYVFDDTVGDTTRRPSRGPIATQIRPDQPPPPPADKDKGS